MIIVTGFSLASYVLRTHILTIDKFSQYSSYVSVALLSEQGASHLEEEEAEEEGILLSPAPCLHRVITSDIA